MKEFIVTLTATSTKEFTVTAATKAEANQLARNIHLNTNLISFSNDDIDEIDVDLEEIDNDKNEVFDFEELFSSASDEQKERILNYLLGEKE
jgi:predicted methyltransferase MtxX (methanogen marker protein 4)